jgi:hypothetical protein
MEILTSLLLTCSDGEPKEDLRLKYVELLTYIVSMHVQHTSLQC